MSSVKEKFTIFCALPLSIVLLAQFPCLYFCLSQTGADHAEGRLPARPELVGRLSSSSATSTAPSTSTAAADDDAVAIHSISGARSNCSAEIIMNIEKNSKLITDQERFHQDLGKIYLCKKAIELARDLQRNRVKSSYDQKQMKRL